MQVGEIADMCLIGRTFGVVHNLWFATKCTFQLTMILSNTVFLSQKFRRFSIYFKYFYKQMLLLSKDFSAFLAISSPHSCAKCPPQNLRFESSFQRIYNSPQIPTSKAHQAEGLYLVIL
jgi:hypothetical protein